MTSCEQLSDRMPEVARGQTTWSAADLLHLDACPACRKEWELVRLAAGLGREWEGKLDTAAIGRSVGERLRRESGRDRRSRQRSWVGVVALAAAASLALVLWAPWRQPAVPAGVPPVAAAAGEYLIPLSGIDSLTADELESVLETMDMPLTGTTSVGTPSLQQLDDQQLERVLRSLEG